MRADAVATLSMGDWGSPDDRVKEFDGHKH
jgi:hypothetical protein